MEPNPYQAPKEAGYQPNIGKPVMAPAAEWMAVVAFASLVIGQLAAFLPKAMFGFSNFWFCAIGLAVAMYLARVADRYPRIPT